MTTDRKSPDNGVSEADVLEPPSGDPPAERPSMAELERELAELLDEAPLLPEDDDEGSGVDFVPPPHLSAPPHASEPPAPPEPPTALKPPAPSAPPELPAPSEPPGPSEPPAPSEPPTALKPPAPSAPPELPAPSEPPAPSELPTPSKPPPAPAPANAAPSVGKGQRALVTTLVVAAALVAGRLWTWPSETQQTRQANVGASTARLDLEPLGAGSVTDPSIEAPAPPPPFAPATSASPGAEAQAEPTVRPVETSGPDAARPFSVVDMLTALAPAGIEAGRCRHAGDPKGRAYVRVSIVAGGTVESVFAGHAYKDSETAACIERKLRAAKLPPFSGEGGSVVIPVDLQ